MTIDFSPNWRRQTNSTMSAEEEEAVIRHMILNSSNPEVRRYAAGTEIGVYVRTGIHSSKSERRQHVQVVLGSNDSSTWTSSSSDSGYTAHIMWHESYHATVPFETKLFDKQPHLKRRGVDVDRRFAGVKKNKHRRQRTANVPAKASAATSPSPTPYRIPLDASTRARPAPSGERSTCEDS